MSDRHYRAMIFADFNAANLAAFLTNDPVRPKIMAEVCGGDVRNALDNPSTDTRPSPELAIVWTRPEAVSPSFATFAATGRLVLTDVLADVDEFADRIERVCERFSLVVLVAWRTPRLARAFSGLAMHQGIGVTHTVMRMNLRLAERIERLPGVTLLDSDPWGTCEADAVDAKLWYAAKIPFRPEVFRRATRDVKSVFAASIGESRRLILLDLDDTLWGGVVGEVGWEALRLGGHDPAGEAYVDFQRTLMAFSKRGVLLGIVSKNDEHRALTAIDCHPEMVLRKQDFAGWRINWDDKAGNILALCRDLNLGLSSAVFIDDNPAERDLVRSALPEVLVPEWPSTPLRYVDALIALGCFDAVTVTAEDSRRSELYAAEAVRASERQHADSTDEWLRRLQQRVEVEELNHRNIPRALQLLNKTNQMNLSTRRQGPEELAIWLRSGQRRMWTFRISDRFGDLGLSGLASLEVEGRRAVLVDFLLSCRVIGRKIEETMLHHVVTAAADLGATEVVASVKLTSRNAPCLRFFESSGFLPIAAHQFSWNVSETYPLPFGVELVRHEAEQAV